MKKLLLLALLPLVLACNKSEQPEPAPQNQNIAQKKGNTPPSSEAFQLLDFNVSKSNDIKITWSAVGETNITGYQLEQSVSNNNFSYPYLIGSFPSSNSNTLITRTHTENGLSAATMTIYYRLKIFHTNSTITYGPIASVTVKGKNTSWQ